MARCPRRKRGRRRASETAESTTLLRRKRRAISPPKFKGKVTQKPTRGKSADTLKKITPHMAQVELGTQREGRQRQGLPRGAKRMRKCGKVRQSRSVSMGAHGSCQRAPHIPLPKPESKTGRKRKPAKQGRKRSRQHQGPSGSGKKIAESRGLRGRKPPYNLKSGSRSGHRS
ncbi:PREDICTED: serine/arginine repetitive matrix protein 2-like [Chinchilla lanigera]|uniref:serine/arginine repetitive matrix protein 2-like n=1 Tax=Chinchilla lanigera TaxID=34839 RepID=UPI00038E9BCB|nr:PREDICTED: serine/arginine repetitive matrix protein 2-like [Chinchilla lanigera]